MHIISLKNSGTMTKVHVSALVNKLNILQLKQWPSYKEYVIKLSK